VSLPEIRGQLRTSAKFRLARTGRAKVRSTTSRTLTTRLERQPCGERFRDARMRSERGTLISREILRGPADKFVVEKRLVLNARKECQVVARHPSRDELVEGLIRVGEQELTGENESGVDPYFAPDFAFHGPDGAELDYEGLTRYFASLRAAFDDLSISRGIMVVEGDYVACQTTIKGTFVREFTHSPVGPLPPNGSPVVFELMNIFRYDDQGRLAEEWVQTDNRSRLRQLGAEGR